jgi:hypothetical protein
MEFTGDGHSQPHSIRGVALGGAISRLVLPDTANRPGSLSASQSHRICVYLLTPECPATAVIRSVRAI